MVDEKTIFRAENGKQTELNMKMKQFGTQHLTSDNQKLVDDNPSLMLEIVVSPSKPQREKLEPYQQETINVKYIFFFIMTIAKN